MEKAITKLESKSDSESELECDTISELELNPPIAGRVDTQIAFSYQWFVWELTGLLQPAGISYRCFLLYSIILNATVTLLFPLTLVINLFFTPNLAAMFENLTITITDIGANFKFLNVFMQRAQLMELRELLRQLDQRANQWRSGGATSKEVNILNRAVWWSHSIFNTFAAMFVVGTALSCFRVIIASERVLLYPAWFPIDWRTSSTACYLMIVGYQVIALIIQAMQECANNSYPPAYVVILIAHIRALDIRIRRIGNIAVEEEKAPKEPSSSPDEVYASLIACIEDYVRILRLHEIIQKILSITCLTQFLCSALIQCTVGMHFLYVSDKHDLSAMILSLIFFVAVTLEVFITCLIADHLRSHSENLRYAFYSINWTEHMGRGRFKRALLITLLRAQRPMVINAAGYSILSIESFAKAMKFAFSVFTLLQRAKQ